MNRIRFFLLVAILQGSIVCFSQPDTLITGEKAKATVKIGFFGISKLNYYGRTDSLKSSGFFPVLELWADKHLYLSAAPVFVYNKVVTPFYAGTVTTAGYMFRNTKWAGNSYISVPIYRANSGLVQARLKLQATTGFTKLTNILNITASADLKYSDKLDYSAAAGLDHLFRFQTKKGLVIALDPSASVNAGTQQFSSTRYKQSGLPLLPPVQQNVEEQVNRFSILSYELSMPTVIAKGKFQFILNPAYVMPQNLITVPGRPDLSERGVNMFYVTAGLKMQLF